MPCPSNKIDSNVTNLAYAKEECLKQLPGTGGADAVWRTLEANSYSDFGGELSTVARSPISQSRQNKKGTVTDLDASGGFNIDHTQNNLLELLEGFFFSALSKKANTTISAAVASTDDWTVASSTGFAVGHIVLAEGMGLAANNGLHVVNGVTDGTHISTADSLADETHAGTIRVVGFEATAGDLDINVTSNIVTLTSSSLNFTTLGLTPGEWIFVGGDGAGKSFVNNKGYARIKTISANAIVFDDVSWTPQTESSSTETVQLFFGTVLKNGATLYSYQLERQLGSGPTATQAEYLEGAVANELTLNIPQTDKLNVDMTFVACDNTFRSGESGDTIKIGSRLAALGENAFNSSSDIYRLKLHINSALTSSPGALFNYVTEGNISINNNASGVKAVGVLGNLDVSVGNFEVGGSLTAIFTTVAAAKAVRDNADVGFSVIAASKNAGFVYDIPLLGLGGGRHNVEKDQPITVPLEPAGAENAHGYTLMHVNFPYLPTLAMPV